MAAAVVSVVIPCHDYGRFLGAAIESVLAQTLAGVQMVVVDDGSSDDTPDVAARYAEARLVRQPQQGASAARNRGLAESSGAFVVFLDADDQLLPDAIESSLERLRARPDCAFAYGHQRFVDADGVLLTDRPGRDARGQACLDEDPYGYMLRRNTPIRAPGALLYRREAVERAGGFRLQGPGEDLDLNLRIAGEHAVCCNDRVVLLARAHGENTTASWAPMLRGALAAQRGQRGYVRRHPAYRRDYREGLRLARSYWGGHLAQQVQARAAAGDLRAALRDLGTLARYHPRAAARLAARLVLRRG